MTLNGVMAVILCYYTECVITESWLRQNSYSFTHTVGNI